MSTATTDLTHQRRWRWTSKNISFGGEPLSFSGKAPEWSKLGVLVPLVVLANLIIRICPTLPKFALIFLYGVCVTMSMGLVTLVRKHPPHVKTRMTAGLATGVGIASLYYGPMLFASSNTNHSSGTFGVGALTVSMGLNLVKECLVLAFPYAGPAGDSDAAAEQSAMEVRAGRRRRRRDRE